jgi:hypothetical protein
MCKKKKIENILHVWHLPFFPLFFVTMVTFGVNKKWKYYIITTFHCFWSPDIYRKRISFASPNTKPIGPWQRIINVGMKICILGTSNSMATCIYIYIYPWCKPKWSRDEFNGQSHILEEQGTTSWSTMYSTPYYKAASALCMVRSTAEFGEDKCNSFLEGQYRSGINASEFCALTTNEGENRPLVQERTKWGSMGHHNVTMGCWEVNLNMSLLVQLFEHHTIIFWGPMEWELHIE